jgi:hypothetical protein
MAGPKTTNDVGLSPMPQDDIKGKSKKAFDFPQGTTKQLLSLATGIIALTITFAKDIVGSLPPATKGCLAAAWFNYLILILGGVWTLMSLTGTLEKKGDDKFPISIRGNNVIVPSLIQIVTFLLGKILTVIYGIISLDLI